MRLRPWTTRAVLLAALPFVVSGCGIGGGGGSKTTTTTSLLNPNLLPKVRHSHRHHHRAKPHPHLAPPGVAALVRRAVSLSQAEPGLHVIGTLSTRAPGAASGRTLMTGLESIGQNAVAARLTVPVTGAHGGVHAYPVRVVVRGGTMYLEPPGALEGLVSPHRKWWALPGSNLAGFQSSPRLGPLVRASSALNAPTAYLTYLQQFAGVMNELGKATVDGIHTTHYKALASVAQAVHVLPVALDATLGPALRAAAQSSPGSLLAVDTWIDPSHLVRRLHLSMSAPNAQLSLQLDYVSYLGVPAPATPPANHTAHPTP